MPSFWINEFNDIIRFIIFPDEKLKTLMKLPPDTNIISFIDNYFIRAGFTNKTLKDETVRIIYGDVGTKLAGAPHVLKQQMDFDIYVKLTDVHNACNDRLVYRTHLIAERIKELLTEQNEHLGGYVFRCIGESDMGTSTIGYTRHNISFAYMKTV